MNRKVLLIEPNYKNKYPPMGLMKLATYYRMVGDDVRFYKGDMRSLAVELICDDLINHLSIILPEIFWKNYYPTLFEFIKLGKYAILEADPIFEDEIVLDAVKEYRKKYFQSFFTVSSYIRYLFSLFAIIINFFKTILLNQLL